MTDKHLVPIVRGRVVLLPPHQDPELFVPTKHFHTDKRYSKIQAEGFEIIPDGPVTWEPAESWMRWHDLTVVHESNPIYAQLLKTCSGEKLKPGQDGVCNRCPHKGISVESRSYGSICPAHGLKFDHHGTVIGHLDSCFLRVPGTVNRSSRIDEPIFITEACTVTQIWLNCDHEGEEFKLAYQHCSSMPCNVGDRLMWELSITTEIGSMVVIRTKGFGEFKPK
jgi:hypothetical protein